MKLSITDRVIFRARQLVYWSKMIAGKSYFHQPQKKGLAFVPGKLQGYFNDVTHKADWKKDTDENSIPYRMLSNGRKFYFPILISQKALAHWDLWLLNSSKNDREEFVKLADWFCENQDDNYGWDTWFPIKGQELFKYSAMSQGQALSVLSRAWQLINDDKYKTAAQSATALFLRPVEEGGVTFFDNARVYLEEVPSLPRNTVLNGWVFALFGLYDYNLVFCDGRIKELFESSLRTLAMSMHNFDCGYWSLYSDRQKNLASPFYHGLHLSQLEVLCQISSEPVFAEYLDRWKKYQNKFSNRTRAFVTKAYQKLKEPARVAFVG